MTKTWKKFGLDIEKGLNYFTMGKAVNGLSSRFDRNAEEYQSWLGGYTVKLNSDKPWNFEDHFKLAIADQNSWLKRYGDSNPETNVEGWELVEIDKIKLGEQVGTLYEYGCTTHSDVGDNLDTFSLKFAAHSMATLYNLANLNLNLKANNFIPKPSQHKYETLDLKGYIAIFDILPRVKMVLYANGVEPKYEFKRSTYELIKNDLLKSIEGCNVIIF